jgi:competence protein ComFC
MSALVEPLKPWLNAALAFLYPETCQICRAQRATALEGFVCEACRDRVRLIEPPYCEKCGLPFEGDLTTPFACTNCRDQELHFSFARSAAVARGVVLEAIHGFKYRRALWFEPFLADLLIRQAAPVLRGGEWDCLIPIPLHPTKQREREFNQAHRLARRLSVATGIPMNSKVLRRIFPTRTQTLLTRSQRAENVRGAFALRNGQHLNGLRIVLVDDVFTTGATASACAKVLLAGGAREVCVWTVARGL